MQRRRTDSEAISSFGYDLQRRLLEVEFISGSIYRYLGVPPEDIEEMRQAPSLGGWFNHVFKPRGYPYVEVYHPAAGSAPEKRAPES